mgnify:CR=1 FL=1
MRATWPRTAAWLDGDGARVSGRPDISLVVNTYRKPAHLALVLAMHPNVGGLSRAATYVAVTCAAVAPWLVFVHLNGGLATHVISALAFVAAEGRRTAGCDGPRPARSHPGLGRHL